jgi:hypothetical protein
MAFEVARDSMLQLLSMEVDDSALDRTVKFGCLEELQGIPLQLPCFVATKSGTHVPALSRL